MPKSPIDKSCPPAKPLTKADLAQFTGTEQVYRHSLVRQMLYTDGVQYVAEAGNAYWLLDTIACAQLEPQFAAEEFQVWTLTVKDDLSACLICADGNSAVILSEMIGFTDFPLAEIKFYVIDNTILLPSEY